MKLIKNGGLELAIFEIVGDENLSDDDKIRKKYLESLPKDKWITLDKDGKAISDEESKEMTIKELFKYSIIK